MNLLSPDPLAEAPAEICGYRVMEVLVPGRTFRAAAESGQQIILKKLDDDCLLRNDLHPLVRDRLSRIRELPHLGIANLHGVVRDADGVYLVWDFVAGQSFDQFILAPDRFGREVVVVARELVLAVEALHLRGIVHGDLIVSNIFILPDGNLRLTHISPLLYTDPAVDAASVLALLRYAVQARGEGDSTLSVLLDSAEQQKLGLRELAARLASITEKADLPSGFDEPATTGLQSPRRNALIGAFLTAIAGIAVAWIVWFAVHSGRLAAP